jgi:hypothetical protein
MESVVNVDIDTATFLTENGIETYIGEELAFTIDLEEEVQEYLNDFCDGAGKVYEEAEEDLNLLIEKFKRCLKLLEDAKR